MINKEFLTILEKSFSIDTDDENKPQIIILPSLFHKPHIGKKEYAQLIGVEYRTIKTAINNGYLPTVKYSVGVELIDLFALEVRVILQAVKYFNKQNEKQLDNELEEVLKDESIVI